ncbi:hypothetical protein CPB86DRAFT_827048 [Serendipita vermifera]|nr:hypothetical protein CPB86DRAFT_827048 [Serendipita vermifera]
MQRWLRLLDHHNPRPKKRVDPNGHERADVVKRRKEYLQELEEFQRLSTRYEEHNGVAVQIPPTLNDGETEHVLSSTMNFVTVATAEGRLVLSDAQYEEQSALPEEGRLPRSSSKLIFPSDQPGGDSYWNSEKMAEQVQETIKLGEYLLPGKTLVFVFDNSSAHGQMAPDALNVKRMTLLPGGKNVPKMRDTIIPLDNPHRLGGQIQTMQLPDHLHVFDLYKQFEGRSKGIVAILEERGLVKQVGSRRVISVDGREIPGECESCRREKVKRPRTQDMGVKEAGDNGGSEPEDRENEEGEINCCLRRMLSMQSDFRDEKCLLHKGRRYQQLQIIADAGHKCIFLPKFHRDLNPIEHYWKWAKRYFREQYDGNFANSKEMFEEALDACPGEVIRGFFQHADRYANVYRLGATGPLAKYAVRRYMLYRTITNHDLTIASVEKERKDAAKKIKNVK